MLQSSYVYIITNKNNTVLYTGVTSDIVKRMIAHKNKTYFNSFTAKYNCEKLVYFEPFQSINEAILREKQIKGSSRKNKIRLIESFNPKWLDLSDSFT